jgi:predicted MFS family arabinose efflux permease
MSLMPLFSESAFMIFYFIASFGMMFVDYAIPSYIYMTVPSGIMARYSSIRMLTHNAGIAIGSALTGVLLSAGLPAVATLIAGALELIVGIVYFLFSKRFGKTLRYSV